MRLLLFLVCSISASPFSLCWKSLSRPSITKVVRKAAPSIEGQEFYQWLSDGGARFEKLRLALFGTKDGGRGVQALRDIHMGETILSVPLSMAIWDLSCDGTGDENVHGTFAESHPIGREMKSLGTLGRLPWATRMALVLVHARNNVEEGGDLVRFAPFLRLLSADPPPNLPHRMASKYDSLIAAEAQSHRLEGQIDTNYFRSVGLFHELCDELAYFNIAAAWPAEEEFLWALDTIQSRVFRLDFPLKEDRGTLSLRMLAPMLDMFNHGTKISNTWSELSLLPRGLGGRTANDILAGVRSLSFNAAEFQDSCELRLRVASTKEGEEVRISYGDKPSDVFFLFYGFCPSPGENPHSAAELYGALSNEQLRRLKALSTDSECHGNHDTLSALYMKLSNSSVATEIYELAFHQDALSETLYWLVASSSAAAKAGLRALDNITTPGALSDVHIAALLEERMWDEINRFPTTRRQDEKILNRTMSESDEASVLLGMLIRLRLDKKIILEHYAALFAEYRSLAISSSVTCGDGDGTSLLLFLKERLPVRSTPYALQSSSETSSSSTHLTTSFLNPSKLPETIMKYLQRNHFPDLDAGLRAVWALSGDTTKWIFKGNVTSFIESAHTTADNFPTSFYGCALHGQSFEIEGEVHFVGTQAEVKGEGEIDPNCWIATQVMRTTSSDGRIRRWQWEMRKRRRPPGLGEWYIESIGSSNKDGEFEAE